MKKLTFTSITSLLSWGNKNTEKRIGDAWCVQKDNLYWYFGTYSLSSVSTEYRLAFVSSKDIGEQE